MNKWVRKAKKIYEYTITKLHVLREQKHFQEGGTDLKYIYRSAAGAKNLVVVFSACTRPGLAARYNYMRTLEGICCNRLYLLDDFGPDGRGSYYLGRLPEFREQEAVLKLVQKVIDETNPEKLLFCGSCKGGYGALNIGSRFRDAIMIIGEPTYRIATEFGPDEGLMRYWMGEITEPKIAFMDNYLSGQLRSNPYIAGQKVYLFYSVKDEYYERHTKPLLKDLEESGYRLEKEEAEFTAHSELSLYFPDFLISNVKEICKG
ncbi:MAG: hypothetical protein ACI4HQ_14830 [Acetatifactor sp.]